MKIQQLLILIVLLSSCNLVLEDKKEILKNTKAKISNDMSVDAEANLASLAIELPVPSAPVANYVHLTRSGNLLFLSGKGPKKSDGKNMVGKLGLDLTVEEGYEAARIAAINQLGVLKSELGDLNRVKRIVKVKGMVNAILDFKDHSKVINGYSDLMVAVFGEQGRHARAAVGVGSLPGNMAVEVEMIVEVID